MVTQSLSPWGQKKSGKGFPAISETKSQRNLGQWRLTSKGPQAEGVRHTGQPWGPLWVKTKGKEGSRVSLVTQMVKDLHAMLEIWVQFLGQEDPLEKEMATHSSFLAWRIPWAEEPAAAAAKSLQLCDFVRPHRRQPTRLPRPRVGCHFLLQCMKVKSERSRSVVSDS